MTYNDPTKVKQAIIMKRVLQETGSSLKTAVAQYDDEADAVVAALMHAVGVSADQIEMDDELRAKWQGIAKTAFLWGTEKRKLMRGLKK